MTPHYMGFLIRKVGREEKMVEVNGEQGRRHWGGEWERDIGILGMVAAARSLALLYYSPTDLLTHRPTDLPTYRMPCER